MTWFVNCGGAGRAALRRDKSTLRTAQHAIPTKAERKILL